MAQIRSIGVGARTTGKVGNVVYVHRNGKTYARSLPIMPAGMYKTPAARKRQAIFLLSMNYIKMHAATIMKSFDAFRYISPRNAFFKTNGKALTQAMAPLAERQLQGETITPDMIEEAVTAYATANPTAIVIGKKMAYQNVYLTGAWPSTLNLYPDSGNTASVVVIHTQATPSSPAPDGNPSSQQVTLSLSASPSNGGSVTGSGSYVKGSMVTVKATPNSGYSFSRWSDGNTNAQRTVTVNDSMTLTAEFTQNSGSGGSQGGYDSGN